MNPESQNAANWPDLLNQQDFHWAFFEFVLQATEPLYLPPYKGSALRGGFGNSFRKVCCVMQQTDCRDCTLKQQCAYAYIFETPHHANMPTNYQAANFPHPFVIEPPETDKHAYTKGETLAFGLVLVGKGISYFPYFVFAFDQLGRMGLGRGRGRYRLTEVYSFNDLQRRERTQVYDGATQVINGNFKEWEFSDVQALASEMDSTRLPVDFITPTRILQRNRLINSLSFELFMRTLLRRSSLLAQIHCETTWNLPYKTIIEQAGGISQAENQLRWIDWERYSNRQRRRMNFGGFVGTTVYQGELAPFLPLILLGQFLHLGKNTTFGLGKYLVRES